MLKGENIRLRTIEPNDIDVLLAWENNTENWRVSNTFVPFSRKLMEEYIFSAQDIFSNKQIRFIIEDLKTKESLGCVDLFDYAPFHLRAGVGVLIDEKRREKGVAKEALFVLKKYCFSHLKLHQLYCTIGASNKASIRLFEKANFIQAGVKKDWLNFGENWEDELFYQCINK